jgi:hypothetical protein
MAGLLGENHGLCSLSLSLNRSGGVYRTAGMGVAYRPLLTHVPPYDDVRITQSRFECHGP